MSARSQLHYTDDRGIMDLNMEQLSYLAELLVEWLIIKLFS
jgi:hypothetical protein